MIKKLIALLALTLSISSCQSGKGGESGTLLTFQPNSTQLIDRSAKDLQNEMPRIVKAYRVELQVSCKLEKKTFPNSKIDSARLAAIKGILVKNGVNKKNIKIDKKREGEKDCDNLALYYWAKNNSLKK